MNSSLPTKTISLWAQINKDLQDGRAERALDSLLVCLEGHSTLQDKHSALFMLPHVAERVSGAAATESRRQRAQPYGITLRHLRSFLGRAEFPAISENDSRFVAVVVTYAEGDNDQIPPGLDAESREAVQHALSAARGIAKSSASLRVDLEVAEHLVRGRSLGLAVGVAALSRLNQREVPEHLVFTGELSKDGQVLAVWKIADKLRLLRESRPLGILFTPVPCDCDELQAHEVSTLFEVGSRVGLIRDTDLERELSALLTAFQCGEWRSAAQTARRLLADPHLRADEQLQIRIVLLSAANHCGETEEAAEQAACIQRMHKAYPLSPVILAHALANRAIHRIDVLQGQEADGLLDQANALGIPVDHPSWMHIRGTRARAKILQGDRRAALMLRKQNVERCIEDEERPRCLVDLADSYLRNGQLDEAERTLSQASSAIQSLGRRRQEYIEQTAQHILLHQVRLCRARGDRNSAAQLIQQGSYANQRRLELLRIEEILVRDHADVAALDRLFDSFPRHHAPIFKVLYFRARLLLGDYTALHDLRSALRSPELDATELCLRVPY